jgi:peptidyl-dipeptidase Dcp
MKYTFVFVIAMTILGSCSPKQEAVEQTKENTDNPLLAEWDTPFGVPPFDKIKSEHYQPAIETVLAAHKEEIARIAGNSEPATFENTVEALELSSNDLNKVYYVFSAVVAANTDSTLKATDKAMAPKLAAHFDDIYLNADLYKRVNEVFEQRESLGLSPEEMMLLTETHKDFIRSGVGLDEQSQLRLREINERLASLSQSFGENLLDETNSFEYHTTDKADLGNLPESLVALAKEEATKRGHDEGWSITLQRPSINPFLQSSPNREARQQLFDGYMLRGNNNNDKDNKSILQEMANLRIEKANLLGYETHSHYVLSDAMAESPDAVFEFLDELWPKALEMAKQERDALAAQMKVDGVDGVFRGSDWRYYVEKVRKERYAFDEEETRPYFEFNAVKDGVFMLAEKLFGLSFNEMNDMPKWHEDQQVYEVLDADGSHLGVLYMDFFARDSKRGGAWMNEIRMQSNVNGMVTPIVTNNFNYPAPTKDSPSLLSYTEAETLFHEFGHALHGLLSNVKYGSLSGTNVPRDFVEFPSQVMENWMGEPEVLKMFAKHYQTGEVIPDEMIKKVKDANDFNVGFRTVEYMAAAYLDMYWHTLTEVERRDVNSFEAEAMNRLGMMDEIIPRYRSTYFAHIFEGGYSSGYYSYIWSEVLDADTFQAFKDAGSIFDQETAARYRKMLSMGGSKPGMELYRDFRGQDPEIEPLLKKKGFL